MFDNHRVVKNSKKPKKYFKYFIHIPGLGKYETNLGKKQISKYGVLIPSPKKKKMVMSITDDWVKAAVTAVPTKGAEHGVAINVAKKPLKKSCEYEFTFLFMNLELLMNFGILNSNWSNMFIINKKITALIITKK